MRSKNWLKINKEDIKMTWKLIGMIIIGKNLIS